MNKNIEIKNLIIYNPFSEMDRNNIILNNHIGEKDYSQKSKREFLYDLLKENMIFYHGVGLASNQIGLDERAFISQDRVYFNPKILETSLEDEDSFEGCLSFPYVNAKVKRFKKIKVSYTNILGETIEESLNGFNAIVFQHEIDHVNGITLYKKIEGSLAKKRFMEKYKKALKNNQ